MKTIAFVRKELMENVRSKRLLIITILSVLMAILGPATALLTPKILELFAEDLSASGMTITSTDITVFDSWMQYFKNIPIVLIVLTIIWAGSFTGEYQKHTLIPFVTKGLSRTGIYTAKITVLSLIWTGAYGLYFAISVYYNGYYWGNGPVKYMGMAILCYWLFGLWIVAAIGFFSAFCSSTFQVILGVGAMYFLCTLLGIVPKLADKLPTALCGGLSLMQGASEPTDFTVPILVTVILIVLLTGCGIALFQKKEV